MKEFIRKLLYGRSVGVSQIGQDFWVIREVFNGKRDGYFVDIGAHDGVYLSNTFLLERRFGWQGVCVDGNPRTFERLKQNRRAKCINACLDDVERDVEFRVADVRGGITDELPGDGEVPGDLENSETLTMTTRTLAGVLSEVDAPRTIDYLSIDVEGAEERILRSFRFSDYHIRSMTVERPSTALRTILEKAGFTLVKEVPDLDCFYVHEAFVDDYKTNTHRFYRKRYFHIRWR